MCDNCLPLNTSHMLSWSSSPCSSFKTMTSSGVIYVRLFHRWPALILQSLTYSQQKVWQRASFSHTELCSMWGSTNEFSSFTKTSARPKSAAMPHRDACTACMAASFRWLSIRVRGQGWQISLSEQRCLSTHLVMATEKYWIGISWAGGSICQTSQRAMTDLRTDPLLRFWMCISDIQSNITLSPLYSLSLPPFPPSLTPRCVFFYSVSVSRTLPVCLSVSLPHSQTYWTIPALLKCHQRVKRE